MTLDLGLSGRRTLVTAGTKGIGAAVVEVLSENGAKVVTTARSIPHDPLASVHYITADLTTPAGCARVAQGALDSPRRHRHYRQRPGWLAGAGRRVRRT